MPARSARLRAGKSLLPAGVIRIDGQFARGDAVVVRGPDTHEIGRGLVAYDAEDAEKIKGRSSPDVMAILGISGRAEMIHRDDLVVGPSGDDSGQIGHWPTWSRRRTRCRPTCHAGSAAFAKAADFHAKSMALTDRLETDMTAPLKAIDGNADLPDLMTELAARARAAARVLALASPEQKNRALDAIERAIRSQRRRDPRRQCRGRR